jgi:hypothetical protein
MGRVVNPVSGAGARIPRIPGLTVKTRTIPAESRVLKSQVPDNQRHGGREMALGERVGTGGEKMMEVWRRGVEGRWARR